MALRVQQHVPEPPSSARGAAVGGERARLSAITVPHSSRYLPSARDASPRPACSYRARELLLRLA